MLFWRYVQAELEKQGAACAHEATELFRIAQRIFHLEGCRWCQLNLEISFLFVEGFL